MLLRKGDLVIRLGIKALIVNQLLINSAFISNKRKQSADISLEYQTQNINSTPLGNTVNSTPGVRIPKVSKSPSRSFKTSSLFHCASDAARLVAIKKMEKTAGNERKTDSAVH